MKKCVPIDEIREFIKLSVKEGFTSYEDILNELYASENIANFINEGVVTKSQLFNEINSAIKKNRTQLSEKVKNIIDANESMIMSEAQLLDESDNYRMAEKISRKLIMDKKVNPNSLNNNEIIEYFNAIHSMISSRFESFTEASLNESLLSRKEKMKAIAEIFETNNEALEEAMEESVAQAFDEKTFDGDTKKMHKLWSPVAKKMNVTPDYLLRMISDYVQNVQMTQKSVKEYFMAADSYNEKLGTWVKEISENASNKLLVSLRQYVRSMIMVPAVRVIENSYGTYQIGLSNALENKFVIASNLTKFIQGSTISDILENRENKKEAVKKMKDAYSDFEKKRKWIIGELNSYAKQSFPAQFMARKVKINYGNQEVEMTYKNFLKDVSAVASNPEKAKEIALQFLDEAQKDKRTEVIYRQLLEYENMELMFAHTLTGIPPEMMKEYNKSSMSIETGKKPTYKGFENLAHFYLMQYAIDAPFIMPRTNIYYNIYDKIKIDEPVLSAKKVRDSLTKQTVNATTGKVISPQIDNIARLNLDPKPDQLASSYQDVNKDLKTTGEYNSTISKLTHKIKTDEIKENRRFDYELENGTVMRNDYLQNGNPEGTMILFDGALIQGNRNMKADQQKGSDIMLNHLIMFFGNDFQNLFGKGKTGQLVEVMSDKGKQIYVPVKKYGIEESKKILSDLQKSKNPEINKIANEITEEKLLEDSYTYLKMLNTVSSKIGLNKLTVNGITANDLALQFAYSFAVNKIFTDHFYYGNPENYSKGFIDKVKREMRASGVNPDTEIEGGMGKTQKALIIPDFEIDSEIYSSFFESLGLPMKAELADGITIINSVQNSKINKSFGNTFDFGGSIKAIYNEMDLATGAHTYIKTNTVLISREFAEFAANFNEERGMPDYTLLNILDLMDAEEIDQISFTTGAKRSKEGKLNEKRIEKQKNAFFEALKKKNGWADASFLIDNDSNPESVKTEILNNEFYYVQQDQRQSTEETEGKMPTQGISYFLPTDSGPEIVSSLNEIARIETERLQEELLKEGKNAKDRVINRQKEGDYNPVIEKMKIPGYNWMFDRDALKTIYTLIGSEIKKKAIDTKVNKNILTEVPALGIKLRTYGGKNQKAVKDIEGKEHWLFPEVIMPAEFANRYIAGETFSTLEEAQNYRGEFRTNPIFEENGKFRVEGDKVLIERIPTSALHSVSLVEIAGFTTGDMENMMIVDPGTQKMSGSDNDGDQRHVMGEYRTKEGKLVTFTQGDQDILDKIDRFLNSESVKVSDERAVEMKKEKRRLEDKKKKALSNKIIGAMKSEYETLLNGKPRNHEYLTTPIDTQKDIEIAQNERGASNKEKPSQLSLVDMTASWDANSNGKTGISIQANDNAAFTYILSQGIKHKFNFPVLKYLKGKVTPTSGNFLNLEKVNGVISKKLNDVIFALANKLNHATDNAKEQGMDELRMGPDTITLASVMRMSGSSNEEVIRYMQSPFFTEIYEKLNKRQSMLSNEELKDIIDGEIDDLLRKNKELNDSYNYDGNFNVYKFELTQYDVNSDKPIDRLMALVHLSKLMNVSSDIQFVLNPIIKMTKSFTFQPWELLKIRESMVKLQKKFDWPGFETSPILERNKMGYSLMQRNAMAIDPFFSFNGWNILQAMPSRFIKSTYETIYDIIDKSAVIDFDAETVQKQAIAIVQKQSGILKEALSIDIGKTSDSVTLSSDYKKRVGDINYENSVREAFGRLPFEEKMILLANQVLNNGMSESVQAKGYFSIIDDQTRIEFGKRKEAVVNAYKKNESYKKELTWIANVIRYNPGMADMISKVDESDYKGDSAFKKLKEGQSRFVRAKENAESEEWTVFYLDKANSKPLAIRGEAKTIKEFDFNKEKTNLMKDFVNHSGESYGGDTYWDLIGREYGVTNHKHYKDAGNANLSKQLRDRVQITKVNYTKDTAPNNPDTGFIFTENAEMLDTDKNVSQTQAIIRTDRNGNRNPNALAIITKKTQVAGGQWSDTDSDFKEFTRLNTELISRINNSGYSKLVFPPGFATEKAKLPTRFATWLQQELFDNFGLVTELNTTKTGLISKQIQGATILTQEQLDKAEAEINDLLGPEYLTKYTDTIKKNLQIRNYYQVYNADAVYAIAKLNSDDNGVKGGTNTAVQLGIKLNKPVYVWDINTEQWYSFEQKTKEKPISAKGKMTFNYNDNKRSDVKSISTIEAIKQGERTATTRYESDGHIDYWKKLKEGDIIEWEGKNGEKVLVEVTKPLHKLVGSGKNAEQWSKLEGWSVDYFNSKVKPRLNEAWQIEYKVVNKTDIGIFEPTETPTLTKNFAGIGSRDIENYNVQIEGKWQPRKEYVGDEKAEKAMQAIKDVYEETLNQSNSKKNYSIPESFNSLDFNEENSVLMENELAKEYGPEKIKTAAEQIKLSSLKFDTAGQYGQELKNLMDCM